MGRRRSTIRFRLRGIVPVWLWFWFFRFWFFRFATFRFATARFSRPVSSFPSSIFARGGSNQRATARKKATDRSPRTILASVNETVAAASLAYPCRSAPGSGSRNPATPAPAAAFRLSFARNPASANATASSTARRSATLRPAPPARDAAKVTTLFSSGRCLLAADSALRAPSETPSSSPSPSSSSSGVSRARRRLSRGTISYSWPSRRAAPRRRRLSRWRVFWFSAVRRARLVRVLRLRAPPLPKKPRGSPTPSARPASPVASREAL